ncbi:unnamed protein product [Hermetia illucens]|uniref:THAP-type domain-containing protein n=1 Tax=Hermetia illucens TaxID=343691 RepID=A0A7R8UWV2_HERIL|nr:uncharacterized protein LOC119655709 isoform X1 [Hermetia illucens]CAD7088582.1 unnamed protein product [Hermetia illucens]
MNTCCIKNCPYESGSYVGAENRISLYDVSSTKYHRNVIWMEAIKPHMQPPLFGGAPLRICQYHFDESCFYKGDVTLWKDGVQTTIPRKRKQLKKTAIPTIFSAYNESQNPLVSTNLQNTGKREVENTSALQTGFSPQPVSAPQAVAAPQPAVASQPRVACRPIAVLVAPVCVGEGESNLAANTKPAVPEALNVCSHGPATKVPGVYSRKDLIRNWNTGSAKHLSWGWGMVASTRGVIFSYHDDSKEGVDVSRLLIVENDMSTKLQIRGRNSTFPILERITCFKDLTSTLLKIMSLRLCENISCKDGCFQAVSKSKSVRCENCRKEKRRMDACESQRIKRLIARKEKLKKIERHKRNLKRRLTRSEKKISLLKKKVEQLMVTCEAANKVKLEELIKSYPKEMQEAIINCQRYATLKDKRGMRYSKEWIAECLKLREKNPPDYLYLRKQKILALPSNAIINSYLKKMNKNCEIDAVVPESTLVGSETALDDSGSVSIAKEEIKEEPVFDEIDLIEEISLDSTDSFFTKYEVLSETCTSDDDQTTLMKLEVEDYTIFQ